MKRATWNSVLLTFASITLLSSSPLTAQTDLFSESPHAPEFDLVIENGRVLDPATGRDQVLNIGIVDGTIIAVTEEDLDGAREIDATGHMVAPGFIDLHTHTPFPFGELLQVKDGVTTALELEAGAWPVADYGMFVRGKARAITDHPLGTLLSASR